MLVSVVIFVLMINARENRRSNQEWTIQRHLSTLNTQDTDWTQTKRNNTTQKSKAMSHTDPATNQGCTHVLEKCKQILLLIKHRRVTHIWCFVYF